VVKALGWQSFDRQFKPYPRAFLAAPSWRGAVAWNAVPEPMVEYMDPYLFLTRII
jgi:hypothetical protein